MLLTVGIPNGLEMYSIADGRVGADVGTQPLVAGDTFSVAVVPEPSTSILVLTATVGLLALRRTPQ